MLYLKNILIEPYNTTFFNAINFQNYEADDDSTHQLSDVEKLY